jgi:hypothetical protein
VALAKAGDQEDQQGDVDDDEEPVPKPDSASGVIIGLDPIRVPGGGACGWMAPSAPVGWKSRPTRPNFPTRSNHVNRTVARPVALSLCLAAVGAGVLAGCGKPEYCSSGPTSATR